MFSGYLQAAVYEGLDGHGLRGWRWLFIMDGIITLPMALWGKHFVLAALIHLPAAWPLSVQATLTGCSGYYALPDLPSSTRVRWLTPAEKSLAVNRMQRIGRALEEPFTLFGLGRVLSKWHVWVYTAYYTFFICSENIGSYMNLWLKSLDRYTVAEINVYPTVMPAITIVTTLIYGWTSDALQLRAPIVYFSLGVCFFAAVNLAVWDRVPFGLKWASYYLTGCVLRFLMIPGDWRRCADIKFP
jgi:ACS family pantothenate transporter-like MFS transporter